MNFHLNAEQSAPRDEAVRFIEHDLAAGWDREHETFAEGLATEREVMTRLASKD